MRILACSHDDLVILLDEYDRENSNIEETQQFSSRVGTIIFIKCLVKFIGCQDLFEHIFGIENEKKAIYSLAVVLEQYLNLFSLVKEDMNLLEQLKDVTSYRDLQMPLSDNDINDISNISLEKCKDRCHNALVYRITRKNILLKTIEHLSMLIEVLLSSFSTNEVSDSLVTSFLYLINCYR